ncbi:MAG: MFS transporter [Candidatus Nanopelagicales bacterium]|nr:MFS transporter [Actinomycetota bacterium]HNL52599.1 MFS transporter [Actinomycetota bacterium]HNO15822.1 MFS transporter [Actinomycetota bacterium]
MTTAADTPATDAPKVAHPWWALTSLLIGLSMIIIDGSVVNVLLPDMVDDLGLTQTDAQWVNSIYSLLFASLLITVGLLADKFGRRLLFLVGIAVFLVGSLASGSANSPEFLIAARAVQAIGASMMLPSSIAVINVLFEGRQRAIAFGMWGAVFGGAAGLGPLLGGWLAEDFSWRWAFLINIPIGVIAAIMVLRTVPENFGPKVLGFDPVGVVLSATGLGLIVFGLIEGQDYGWWTAVADFSLGPIHLDTGGISVVPVALGLGILLLAALILWERQRAKTGHAALVDLSLFGIRRYGFGNVVALVVSLGEFGILFVLPLWMQSVHGTDPLTTGVILASLAVGTLASGGAARRVSATLGPTQVVRLGMALEIVGIVAIGLTLSVDRSPWWLVIPLIVYGLGLGFASAQLTNVVLSDVPALKSGQASAMTSTFRQVGSALGAAILGAVLFSGLGAILSDDLAKEAGLTQEQRVQIDDQVKTSAGQAIVGLEKIPGMSAVVDDAKSAYTDAARDTAWVAAVFVFFGLITSFGLPKDDPDRESTHSTPPA